MKCQLEVGDVVALRGSPQMPMTIIKKLDDNHFLVVWLGYVGSGGVSGMQDAELPEVALIPYAADARR